MSDHRSCGTCRHWKRIDGDAGNCWAPNTFWRSAADGCATWASAGTDCAAWKSDASPIMAGSYYLATFSTSGGGPFPSLDRGEFIRVTHLADFMPPVAQSVEVKGFGLSSMFKQLTGDQRIRIEFVIEAGDKS